MIDEAKVEKFRIYNKDKDDAICVIFSARDDECHRQSALEHVWGQGRDCLSGVYTLQRLAKDGTWEDTAHTKVGQFGN